MKKKSSGCLVFFFKVESGFISESIPPLKVRLVQRQGVEAIEDFRVGIALRETGFPVFPFSRTILPSRSRTGNFSKLRNGKREIFFSKA